MEQMLLAHGNGADELGLLGIALIALVLAFVLAERSARRAKRGTQSQQPGD